MASEICSLCMKDDPNKSLWVQCELCDQWVHVTCIPMKYIYDAAGEPCTVYPKSSKQIKRYNCSEHGEPLLETNQINRKRKNEDQLEVSETVEPRRHGLRKKKQLDYISLNEGELKRSKNEHPHVKPFLACFARWENTTNVIKSSELETQFDSIRKPLKVVDPENSGMQIPSGPDGKTLTVDAVTHFLGDHYKVDVMDVQSQQNSNWTMSQWNHYFTECSVDTRDRIRNVISLEVSHVDKFQAELQRPRVVEAQDLVNKVWNIILDESERPKVTKYVLMSVENAFTDFHLDFAGTSVYYKVVSGAKKFLLFPPTPHNLDSYTKWCDSVHQNLIFLGDELEDGVAMDLGPGDLFMIPCGYIHAVYTPRDSLVIGGNFLTLRDLETQLQIVEIERRTKVPKKFTFPQFDIVMGKTSEWFLAQNNPHSNELQPRQVHALVAFLQDSRSKYKPVNFSTKKELSKQLLKTLQEREKSLD
ncbi:LAME_0A02124g1_1 [Lachancea meyersii CBS 8951]|uniref:JmjC domain-containing histone demethylation protein 1 n=1 Tax=Lachancea meyersii CBS 8951 TaxID=1266667 RepID=A0A1G4IM95_9SACH|nr:LAME_0A02124g1_1 [Lachancea meyersii CBS 8951]